MTSTTPIEPSVEGLATWLRNMADNPWHGNEKLLRWASAVESLALERIAVPEGQASTGDVMTGTLNHAPLLADELDRYAKDYCAGRHMQLFKETCRAGARMIRALYLKTEAAPQAVPAQAEITYAEIDAITDQQWGTGCLPNQYQAHRAFARAILSARKDRADALLREAAEVLEFYSSSETGIARRMQFAQRIRTYLKGEAP